jgi:hypothetical protein
VCTPYLPVPENGVLHAWIIGQDLSRCPELCCVGLSYDKVVGNEEKAGTGKWGTRCRRPGRNRRRARDLGHPQQANATRRKAGLIDDVKIGFAPKRQAGLERKSRVSSAVIESCREYRDGQRTTRQRRGFVDDPHFGTNEVCSRKVRQHVIGDGDPIRVDPEAGKVGPGDSVRVGRYGIECPRTRWITCRTDREKYTRVRAP